VNGEQFICNTRSDHSPRILDWLDDELHLSDSGRLSI
jgi:hypothetical protein